jgi:hypothetical protein
MAISAQGMQAWVDLWDKMRASKANRPYVNDLAKANRDYEVGKSQISLADALTRDLKNRTDISKTGVETGLLNKQIQYYAPNILSEIGARNAEAALNKERTKYYGDETRSNIDWRKSESDKNREETKYVPLKYLLETIDKRRQSSRFGPAYELSRYLNGLDQSSRATWIAENQGAYNKLISDVANNALNPEEGAQNAMIDSAISTYFPQQSALMPKQDAPQGNAPLGMLANATQSNSPVFGVSPESTERMKRAAELTANRKLVTAATQRQVEGAQQVASIMNDPELQSKVQSASVYAGAWGKGKQALDALSQKNPQAYEDYLSLVNQDMVLLGNRIKTLDQMGATDAQREELTGLFNKTMNSALSNPRQFIQQFNNLGKSLERVAKGVIKSGSPVYNMNQAEAFNPIQTTQTTQSQNSKSTYSAEDIKHTAQKYGMTEAEVKRKLGMQ